MPNIRSGPVRTAYDRSPESHSASRIIRTACEVRPFQDMCCTLWHYRDRLQRRIYL